MTNDKMGPTVTFADDNSVKLTFVPEKSVEVVCLCGQKVIAGDLSNGAAAVVHM